MLSSFHPTKAKLVETAVELLETKLPTDISVDEILEISGISKGSLYHHFEDLGELLEFAQIARYAAWVDRSVGLIVSIISQAKTQDELFAGVVRMSEITQSLEFKPHRYERARTIANSVSSPRFAAALAVEQKRLTDSLEDVIREVKEKGFFKKDLNPRVAAVFIQSYTLGKIVDDVVDSPVDQKAWNDFINNMVKSFMFPK
ncbi:AcrR Transcriptional regulator [Candidatus Nanopelagicaceae bacterium]